MQTQTVKEKITKVVLSQPEDATYDEIMKELAFARMVDRGLEDVRAGQVISNSEMASRIRAWKKYDGHMKPNNGSKRSTNTLRKTTLPLPRKSFPASTTKLSF